MAADGRIFFHKDDLLSAVCNIQRRLNSGNAAADNERGFRDRNFDRIQRLIALDFFNHHRHEVDGFIGGGISFGMNPGTMLAQVRHFAEERIQSHLRTCFSESRFMHAGRTCGDYNSVEFLFFDGFPDKTLSRFGTHIFIIDAEFDTRNGSASFCYFRTIHRCTDILTAMADKNSDS